MEKPKEPTVHDFHDWAEKQGWLFLSSANDDCERIYLLPTGIKFIALLDKSGGIQSIEKKNGN